MKLDVCGHGSLFCQILVYIERKNKDFKFDYNEPYKMNKGI